MLQSSCERLAGMQQERRGVWQTSWTQISRVPWAAATCWSASVQVEPAGHPPLFQLLWDHTQNIALVWGLPSSRNILLWGNLNRQPPKYGDVHSIQEFERMSVAQLYKKTMASCWQQLPHGRAREQLRLSLEVFYVRQLQTQAGTQKIPARCKGHFSPSMKVVQQQKRLFRKTEESPSLEIFNTGHSPGQPDQVRFTLTGR